MADVEQGLIRAVIARIRGLNDDATYLLAMGSGGNAQAAALFDEISNLARRAPCVLSDDTSTDAR